MISQKKSMLTEKEREYFPEINTPEDVFFYLDKYVRDFDPAKANSIQKAIDESKESKIKTAFNASKFVYENFREKATAAYERRQLEAGFDTDEKIEADFDRFMDIEFEERDKYNLSFLEDIHWKAKDLIFAEGERYMLAHIDSPEAMKVFQKHDMKKEDVKNIFYNVLHYHPSKKDDLLNICLRADI